MFITRIMAAGRRLRSAWAGRPAATLRRQPVRGRRSCVAPAAKGAKGDGRLRSKWLAGGLGVLLTALLDGCASLPMHPVLLQQLRPEVRAQVMAREDRIVPLFGQVQAGKPALILLHGATDDPTEMLDLAQETREQYQVFLYCYNYHQRMEKVAAKFIAEYRRLDDEAALSRGATVVDYSYSAIVFREAVLSAREPALFARTRLIQLAPTAGGSFLARTMILPEISWLVSLASHPSVAANPNGPLARRLWGEQGARQFDEAISPDRVCTIVVEGDHHSLARSHSRRLQARYRAGIGTNVVVLPRFLGVNHDFLPSNPILLEYVRTKLEPASASWGTSPPTADPGLVHAAGRPARGRPAGGF